MRYFFITFFVLMAILGGLFVYYYQQTPSTSAVNGQNLPPVELDENGFTKEALKKQDIEQIQSDELDLTIAGDENSPLKVVVFYDYNCPYCVIEELALHEALEGRDDVRVVLRPVPFMGQGSFDLARLALGAAKAKKFKAFHSAISQAQGKMTMDRAISIIEEQGIGGEDIMQYAMAPATLNDVQNNQKLAIEVGAQYVPAFVIGERIYMPLDRDTTPEEFTAMFDFELKKIGQ